MQCMFGPMSIRRSADQQELQLIVNRQIQGAAFFDPPSTWVSPDVRPGPGPISACAYSLGWLLAGYSHPDSQMVMVGLGSGAGATQLLAACPDVLLTVVEICPKIIAAAEQAFPLLEYYQNLGRLQIVQADAAQYLDTQRWDVGLLDAYTGKSNALEATYLDRARNTCDRLYINVIDSLHGPLMAAVLDWLEISSTPATEIYRATNVLRGTPFEDSMGNWIVTDDPQDDILLERQMPFEHAPDSPGRTFALANWSAMLDSRRSVSA